MKWACWHKWKKHYWFVVFFITPTVIKKEYQLHKICTKCEKEILPDYIENFDSYMFVNNFAMDSAKLSNVEKELYKEALAFGEAYKN